MEKVGLEAVLDDKDFQKGITSYQSALNHAVDTTKAAAGKIGGGFTAMGKGALDLGATLAKIGFAAAAAGVTAFAGALTFSVKAAMEAQKVDAQLNAVLASTKGAAGMSKDAIVDLANGLSQLTMFEDDAIISAQSMLLTFTNIGKDVFPATTEAVLNVSQAMGQDLKSSAVQLGKALNDPINGISALTRIGVTFTEGQKATIKSMVEMGNVAGAQKIILAELNTEFGNSARAAGETFSGQLTILKNNLGNVAESIGMALLPQLTAFAKTINTTIASPQVQAMISGMATALGQLFGGNMTAAIASFSGALSAVFGPKRALEIYQFLLGIQTNATTVFTFVRDKVVPILAGAFNFLKNTVIPPLRDALETVWGKIREGKAWIDANGPAIMNALTTAWDTVINTVIPPLRDALTTVWDAIKGGKAWIDTNGPAIMDKLSGAFALFGSNSVFPLKDQLFLFWLSLKDIKFWIEIYGPGMMKEITQAFNDIKDIVVPALKRAMAELTESFNSVKTWLDANGPLIRSIWNRLMTDITGDTTKAKTDIPNIWKDLGTAINMATDDFFLTLGTNTRLALQLINGDWKGARKTLEEGQTQHGLNMNAAADSFMKIHNKLIGDKIVELKADMDTKMGEVRQKMTDRWNEIKGDVRGTWEEIKKTVTGFIEEIKNAFRNIQVHIPTPHFSGGVNWEQIGPVSVPVPYVNVNWYKKGLDAIIDKPTIIGVGEAGPERVIVQPAGRVTPPAVSNMSSSITNNWNLNAMYRNYESEGSLRDTVRLLQAGVG